ncbi:MAG: hypothetical protein ACI8TQ_000462 [Planctomycetota bacterium]|jgi:hypothetical protein
MKSFTTNRKFLQFGPRLRPIWNSFALLAFLPIWTSCGSEGSEEADISGAGLVVVAQVPLETGDLGHLDDEHGHTHVPNSLGLMSEEELGGPIRSYYHNFGTVADGDVAAHTFQLRNSDRLPVTITRMSPSCGCTVPSVRYFAEDGSTVRGLPSNEPEILVIPPGAMVELDIHIDTNTVKSKNVTKLMQVRITTDSQNDPYLTLECSITVEQAFYVDGDFLSLGNMPISIGGEGRTEISLIGDSASRLSGIGILPPGLSAELNQQAIIGRPVWELIARVEPPLKLGNFTGQIELLTEGADGEARPPLLINLRGSAIPDIAVSPPRFFFQDIRSDGIATIAAEVSTMIPGARFKILSAETTGTMKDFISVEFFPRDNPNDTSAAHWTVKATASPDIDVDRFSGTIELVTDDPQTPQISVIYAGL